MEMKKVLLVATAAVMALAGRRARCPYDIGRKAYRVLVKMAS
jgi:hypothetical protein